MRPEWQVVEGASGEPRAAWGPIAVARPNGGDGRRERRPVRVESGSCSLRGNRRSNDDWVVERPPLFVVADGFGTGALAGTASRVACQEAVRLWEGGARPVEAVRRANAAVRTVQDLADEHGFGTTLVLAGLLDGNTVEIAWAGDSAALLVRPAERSALRLTPCERTASSRPLGPLGAEHPLVREACVELAPGDVVALATDGVWEPLGNDLAGILAGSDKTHGTGLRAAAARICREAVGRGGDNASVVLFSTG